MRVPITGIQSIDAATVKAAIAADQLATDIASGKARQEQIAANMRNRLVNAAIRAKRVKQLSKLAKLVKKQVETVRKWLSAPPPPFPKGGGRASGSSP